MSECEHRWQVFGRGPFESKQLHLECSLCAQLGYVVGTEEEWHLAADAHREIYSFDDVERVVDTGAKGVLESRWLKRKDGRR